MLQTVTCVISKNRTNHAINEDSNEINPDSERVSVSGFVIAIRFRRLGRTSAKEATEATKASERRALQSTPFSDNTDFTNAHKGFIAALPPRSSKANKAMSSGIRSSTPSLKRGKSAGYGEPEPVAPVSADQHQRPV
jgi:hypothetical protein